MSSQCNALAMGQLAIARGDRCEFDLSALVPHEIAQKLAEFSPDRVLLLHPENSGVDSNQEWGNWE